MRISLPSLYAKPPPAFARLSRDSRALIDAINPRNVRPSQLKALADALTRDDAISPLQRVELTMARKPHADQASDEAFDFVSAMDLCAAGAAEFQRYVPDSGATAYYQGMMRFAQWLDKTSALHRKAPLISAWA